MSENNGISKIDAVKEILFGQNMKEYDERFSSLEMTLRAESDKKSELLHKEIKAFKERYKADKVELDQRIKQLEKLLTKKIDLLQEQKANRKDLKKYLLSLAESI